MHHISTEQEPFVIDWLSNAGFVHTGYGRMTDLFLPRIEGTGRYRVIECAYYGIQASSTQYAGRLVLPCGQDPYGNDIIAAHVERTRASGLITLLDSWVLDRGQIRDIRERIGAPVFCWHPVDCQPLSVRDREFFAESGARPVAMSRFGQAELIKAGFADTLYVPHGVDVSVYKPLADRDAVRRKMNFAGRFVALLAAANKDQIRKSFPESFEAFRIFRERHPEADALLSVHSLISMPTGVNLMHLAQDRGIADCISFTDQYSLTIGAISPDMMAEWLGAGDILLNPAYGGGFELTPLEGQACGTPPVVNDCSAMTELAGAGWKVRGQKFYNGHHRADWQVPFIRDIVRALEQAYEEYKSGAIEKRREKARKFALRYDADLITRKYWVPVLAEIEAERHRLQVIGGERDAAVARLSRAWSDGILDAEAFGARAGQALSAARAEDLAVLTADLPDVEAA